MSGNRGNSGDQMKVPRVVAWAAKRAVGLVAKPKVRRQKMVSYPVSILPVSYGPHGR